MSTATLTRPAPALTPAPLPAHREPAYLRYLGGQAVSILGDQVWYVALSYAAVQLASPGVAGVVLAVSALPRLALLLFGGAFVDRYGPRRLMIGSDLARGVIALITAAVALGQPSLTLLVVVALAFGLADALFLPAAGAMLPRLLGPAQLTGGLALSGLTARLALTFGAPLGGLLLPLGGLPLACLVNAATFAVSVLALWSVRPAPGAAWPTTRPSAGGSSAGAPLAGTSAAGSPSAAGTSAGPSSAAGTSAGSPSAAGTSAGSPSARGSAPGAARGSAAGAAGGSADSAPPAAREPVGAAVRDGLRYLARHRMLRAVTLTGLLVNLGAVGPLNVGLAIVSDQRGWGAGGIGVMLAGFGVGSVAGNLLMLRWRPATRLGAVIACCAATQGVALFAIAVAPTLAGAFAATAVGGLAGGPQAVLLSGLTHTHTADSHRGRVASINSLASLGVTPLAIAATGVAASRFGTVYAFAACTALVLLAAAYALSVPTLRQARLGSAPTVDRR